MFEIYTDGASRGNPGDSASSFIVVKQKQVIYLSSEYIGKSTNNVAEYRAIINALTYAVNHKIKKVALTSDSELVISQIIGRYKIKASHLKKLYEEAISLSKYIEVISFSHSKRENRYIKISDKLCNMMLDLM
jgi:ribonuclease HI